MTAAWEPHGPFELWRVNVPGRATVTCSLLRTGEMWSVTLDMNGQMNDVADFPTREAALAAGEQWRRDWPSRVIGKSPFPE